MTQLSVLIPSRNEQFLNNTIQSILENIRADTEVIVVLDGQWPVEPIPDHERVTMIYHPVSVGQRAACNEAARVSTAKYVMKLDAHCSVGEGFDVIMMEDMQPTWTMVPLMKNLHAFDWLCQQCGHRQYQGPTPEACPECEGKMERDILWKAKKSPNSTSMCFDRDLRFKYWGAYKKHQKGDLVDTMSILGACWMLERERYFELNICDERHGGACGWGQQGTEVACATWLSGGRLVCNRRTWFAHMFRRGGDFGFPYPIKGNDINKVRKYSQHLWKGNNYDKAIHPLSWLIEKFWPVPGWDEENLASIRDTAVSFVSIVPSTDLSNEFVSVLGIVPSIPSSVADHTASVPINGHRKDMSVSTMGLPSISRSSTIPRKDISTIGHELQVNRVTAEPVIADMAENRNVPALSTGNGLDKPSIHKSVDTVSDCVDTNRPIATGSSTRPDPAPCLVINSDLSKEALDSFGGDVSDNKHLIHTQIVPLISENGKSILYYTDNRLDPKIMSAVQDQLLKANLPIVSVSLKPIDFGRNIVIDAERGPLTMFRQILAGLEAIGTDIVYLAEHDTLYDPSHFDFIPKHDNLFCYNNNLWKVDVKTGRTLFHYSNHTSQLCAKRELLLEHYRKRVAMVEEHGFSRRIGYEPGTNRRKERVDDYWHETWMSAVPNVDIRHGKNLTRTRWTKEEFRNQKYTKGWTESDTVPGWGTLNDFLPNLT